MTTADQLAIVNRILQAPAEAYILAQVKGPVHVNIKCGMLLFLTVSFKALHQTITIF